MEIDLERFREQVRTDLEQVLAETGRTVPDPVELDLAVREAVAHVGQALQQLATPTALPEVFVLDAETGKVRRIPFANAAREVGRAAAVGVVLAALFPPAGVTVWAGAAAGAGYATVKRSLEWLFGKKSDQMTDRDGAVISALIVLQYDPRKTAKQDGVFPSTAEVLDRANQGLKATLRFRSVQELAVRLDELKKLGMVQEKGEDRWDLAEAVWVTP